MVPPRLHPTDPLKRARNRAWTDFTPTFSAALGGVMYAKTADAVEAGKEKARQVLGRLEEALASERGNDGPYFNGPQLSLVDAAYAPFLQRFAIVDGVLKTALLSEFPRVAAWAEALLANPVVTGAVPDNFAEEYRANLKRREAHAFALMEAGA
jgi:glutathione S-transferase